MEIDTSKVETILSNINTIKGNIDTYIGNIEDNDLLIDSNWDGVASAEYIKNLKADVTKFKTYSDQLASVLTFIGGTLDDIATIEAKNNEVINTVFGEADE